MYQICKLSYPPLNVWPKLMTLRGRISVGSVVFDGYYWNLTPSGANGALGPVVMSVTAHFAQSGSGSNQLYICERNGCPVPTDSTLITFSKSGTYTTSGTLVTAVPRAPSWRLVVEHGHDVSVKNYTVRLTYTVLK